MKEIVKKILTIMLLISSLFLTNVDLVSAKTLYQTDVKQASNGNVFISVDGTFYSEDVNKMINRINKIRKEACDQGMINPATGQKLTSKDYKPVKWSNKLEEYARIRAVEISVNWDHKRPNNQTTFKTSMAKINGYHSGENIAAGYSLLSSIEAYYEEKPIYKKNYKNSEAGHYSIMINPNNTLVGMVGFAPEDDYIYSAMEFGVSYGSNDNSKIGYSGFATQIVEVNTGFLLNSVSLSGSDKVDVGKNIKLKAILNLKDETPKANLYSGGKWSSSNTKIATVDQNGNVKGIAKGSVTISVNVNGKVASKKITVNNINIVKVSNLKLNTTSKSLLKGASFTLNTTVSPNNATNKKVTYTSSNTKVATVDSNGKVVAKAAGSATITVKSTDGSNKTATCKVTVTNPIKVTSVSLNKTSLTIYKGYTYNLKTTVNPSNATNKNVTYKSSNTNIATVNSNGKITAKATGTTTITVTAADGSNKTATCKVVVKNPVRVTGIKLNATKITLSPKGTYQLKAIINPSNATNKNVTWKSSDANIATVDSNGKVVAKKAGVVIITATTKDGNKIAACKVTVR